MLKKYKVWLYAAMVVQVLLGVIQLIFLFKKPVPMSEEEARLFTMLATVPVDPGGGVSRTFDQLHMASQACLVLLCFYSAAVTIYVLRRHADGSVVRGITGINALIFGIFFVVAASLTFIPLIILSGLIFVLTLAAFFTHTANSERADENVSESFS